MIVIVHDSSILCYQRLPVNIHSTRNENVGRVYSRGMVVVVAAVR
jgi:hypothetical protein